MENKSQSADNTFDKAEKVKKNMRGYAEKSKDTIKEMIDSSIKILESAAGKSTKGFEEMKKSYGTAEDTFDTIINSYTRQMEQIVDFNTKLVDLIKESNPDNADKFLNLINDNFERTRNATADNTKEILDLFNKHSNLKVNFNLKFAKTVNTQIENLFQTQKNSLDKFTNWASEWWKE